MRKDGGLTGRLFAKTVCNVDGLGTYLAHGSLDFGVKLPLVDESVQNDGYMFIVPRLSDGEIRTA